MRRSSDALAEPRLNTSPWPRTDAALRRLARLMLRSFYARIEVIGKDRIPPSGPVVVVANHFNSLVDGAVIAAFLPRMPRFLAASTVWNYRPIVGILNAAGTVPIHRAQDGRAGYGVLSDTLCSAATLLSKGGVLAVFPEGVSHNEPRVLPLKTGAARIALLAEAEHGPMGLSILPVCLTFEHKNRFRSRVLVEIGRPIEVCPDAVAAYRSGSKPARSRAAKDLTIRLARELQVLTPNHDSWEDARLIGRATEILSNSEGQSSDEWSMAELADEQRTVREGYAWIREMFPERTATLRRNLAVYDSMLRTARLRDRQVAQSTGAALEAAPLRRTILRIAVSLPAALVGALLNVLPFQLMAAVSKGKDRDKRSTWSIFGGLLVFPVFWMIAAIALGVWTSVTLAPLAGWLIGLMTLIAAPLTGERTLKVLDQLRRIAPQVRARKSMRPDNALGQQLVEQRRLVLEDLGALSEAYNLEQERISALSFAN